MITAVGSLLAAAALTLLVASGVHGGLLGPLDRFPGAAIPEAMLGAALAAAAVGAFVSLRRYWGLAVGALVFAVAGTLFGLSVTIPRGGPGDIVYHLALLGTLLITAVVLFGARPSRA